MSPQTRISCTGALTDQRTQQQVVWAGMGLSRGPAGVPCSTIEDSTLPVLKGLHLERRQQTDQQGARGTPDHNGKPTRVRKDGQAQRGGGKAGAAASQVSAFPAGLSPLISNLDPRAGSVGTGRSVHFWGEGAGEGRRTGLEGSNQHP